MKGQILKEYTGNSHGGIPQFLTLWQEDAVTAVAEHHMGDRDSYPGQYVSDLIKDGFILRDEVEQACLEWLRQKKFLKPEVLIRRVIWIEEVISIAMQNKFNRVLAQLALHFDELEPIVETYDLPYNSLVTAVVSSGPTGELRNKLLGLFDAKFWTDGNLFRDLYVNDVSVPKSKRDDVLKRICRKVRRVKKATGDNMSEVACLRYMLYGHFDPNWANNGENAFLHTKAMADQWLAFHAAECPFPVRGERSLRK